MSAHREMKRRARQQLHERLAETVLYLSDREAEPVPVTVRLHMTFGEIGDLLATRVGFAERQEMTPRIVFLNAQVRPVRDAYVITEDMGAFKVDNDLPPDDITTTVEVAEVLAATAMRYGWDVKLPWCGLPPPEET